MADRTFKKTKKLHNCYTCAFGPFGNKSCAEDGYAVAMNTAWNNGKSCKRWNCFNRGLTF